MKKSNIRRSPGRLIGRIGVVTLALCMGIVWANQEADHRSEQPRPIELGASGGNINDRTNLFCCSGTLGGLVENASGQFILSNNHVLARSNNALLGEMIIQPGLIDQTPVCFQDAGDTVAHLSDFVPIQFKRGLGGGGPENEMDAAIAEVVAGAVDPSGSILAIGPVSANTVAASLGQVVQKSGRTTGHTLGEVAAIDVTVEVGYSRECGGSVNQTARFVNQIRITPGTFSAGGDSGSLIVESDSVDPSDGLPRAVGLLFAGSSTSTLANPIDSVLSAFGVSMVGGTPSDPDPDPDPGGVGAVSGAVTDASSGNPISGASVSVDTGQSATTSRSGSYTINDVPAGERQVTASAAGYPSDTKSAAVFDGATTVVNFALGQPTEGSDSIVECVTYNTTGGPDGDRDLLITIQVVNDLGNHLAGAEVRIDVFHNGSLFASGSGSFTDSQGEVTYTARRAPDGNYFTVVTDVISALEFEGSTPENSFDKGIDSTPDANCRPAGSELTSAGLQRALEAKGRNTDFLFNIQGVVGVGVGRSAEGSPVVEVYLSEESFAARSQIPAFLEDVPVRVIVTGAFIAF